MLAGGEKNLKTTGNYRVINLLNNHNPVYVSDTVLAV